MEAIGLICIVFIPLIIFAYIVSALRAPLKIKRDMKLAPYYRQSQNKLQEYKDMLINGTDLSRLLDRIDGEIEVTKINWKSVKTLEARNLWLDARWTRLQLEEFAPHAAEAREAIRLKKISERQKEIERERARRQQEEQRRRREARDSEESYRKQGSESEGRGRSDGNDDPKRSDAMTELQALQILGLKNGATPAEIRTAYNRLMKRVHPDLGGSDYLAKQLNQARDSLLR